MRWCHAGTGVLLLMLLAGCPSGFGKDGRVSKAIHQDTVDLYIKRCSTAKYEEVCGGAKRDTENCRRECG